MNNFDLSRKFISPLMLFLPLLLLAGCAANMPAKLTHNKDPYTGVETFNLFPIWTKHCQGKLDGIVVKIGVLGGKDLTTLYVNYQGDYLLSIDIGRGLDVLIDSEPVKLKGIDREINPNAYGFNESAFYQVDKATLVNMGVAESIRFRIPGRYGYVERCIPEEKLQEFARAADQVID